jgi:MFS family permease
LTSAIGPSILALIGDEANIMYRGTVMGIYSVVLGLGIGVGSLLGGFVASVYPHLALNGLAAAALGVYAVMTALHMALLRTYGIYLRDAAPQVTR